MPLDLFVQIVRCNKTAFIVVKKLGTLLYITGSFSGNYANIFPRIHANDFSDEVNVIAGWFKKS